MGFNSAFKGLNQSVCKLSVSCKRN